MTVQPSKHALNFQLPDMLSYHSTWDDADYPPVLPSRRPGLTERLLRRVKAAVDRRRTLRELSSMTDRELADIGISRYDIDRLFDPEFAREYASRGLH